MANELDFETLSGWRPQPGLVRLPASKRVEPIVSPAETEQFFQRLRPSEPLARPEPKLEEGQILVERGIPAGPEAEYYRVEHGLAPATSAIQKSTRRQYLINQARRHGVPQNVLANQIRKEGVEEEIIPTTLEAVRAGKVARGEITLEEAEKGKREEKAPSRTTPKTKYIPIGGDKFQLSTIEPTGETTPITREGKPVVLTEKQVLIAEGKKAQSLINPYETKFLSKLGESESKRITELKTKAVDSVASKKIIGEARALLDQGIYTGTAANIRKDFDKLLQEANIFIGGRKAANTEAYASMMGLQVGKIIKQFGAGTGLSDADREYAEKIVGGKITLTEDAIRRLLDINDRLADFTISEYNSQAERAKRDIEEKDYLRPIEVPKAIPRKEIQEPQLGTIEDGYRFRGGDPSNPANWEQIS